MGRQKSVSRVVVFLILVLVAFATTGVAWECPEFAGHMPGDVSVVEVSGDLAYFGSGSSLLIADVSDPTRPRVVGSIGLPDTVIAISVAGAFAYVGTSYISGYGGQWSSAFHVVDVSAPWAPVEVGLIEAQAPIHGLAVEGGHAYIVGGGGLLGGARINGFLQVIDVSNPLSLTTVASVEAIWWMPEGVAVANGHAYVADSDSGVRVFDVSVSSAPVQVGSHGMSRGAGAVTVSDDYIYVVDAAANSGELCVMDVSTPSTPVEVGVLETSGDVLGVEVSNGYAYIPEGEAGVRVIDVRVPSAPVQAGFIETPGEGLGVAVADDRAYIADGREGLRVMDVSEPTAPVAGGRVDAIVARGVAAADSFAYVASSDGFAVIDMSSPSAPAKVGFLELDLGSGEWSFGFPDVAVTNGYAYVVGEEVLHVIDTSEPSAPAEVGFVSLGDDAMAVGASSEYVYVAGFDCLHIIDVRTPAAPLGVSTLCGFEYLYDVRTASNGLAYLLGFLGLWVVDVSDPFAPVELGAIEVGSQSGGSCGFSISGGYAYVASIDSADPWWLVPEARLSVIDLNTPSAPQMVASLNFGESDSSNVAVSGNRVFVWTDDAMHVIDVSIPSAPVEVRSLASPGVPHDLERSGGYVYAATGDAGMYMLDTWGCRHPYQNPDQPTAEVE